MRSPWSSWPGPSHAGGYQMIGSQPEPNEQSFGLHTYDGQEAPGVTAAQGSCSPGGHASE